ncbi:MAG: hypothetical protein NT045_05050 [Candidatus Aureabacteria bacterium]|nr:hypothetical protein [Candidatus Auribacterota bacterium]
MVCDGPGAGTVIGGRTYVEVELEIELGDEDTGAESLEVKLEYYDGSAWHEAMGWAGAGAEAESDGFDPHGSGGYCYKAPVSGSYQYFYFIIEDYLIGEVLDYRFRVCARDPSGLTACAEMSDLIKRPHDPPVVRWINPAPGSVIGGPHSVEVEHELTISSATYSASQLECELFYYDGSAWHVAMDWTRASVERDVDGFDPHGSGGYCFKASMDGNYQYYYFVIEDYDIGAVSNYAF